MPDQFSPTAFFTRRSMIGTSCSMSEATTMMTRIGGGDAMTDAHRVAPIVEYIDRGLALTAPGRLPIGVGGNPRVALSW